MENTSVLCRTFAVNLVEGNDAVLKSLMAGECRLETAPVWRRWFSGKPMIKVANACIYDQQRRSLAFLWLS